METRILRTLLFVVFLSMIECNIIIKSIVRPLANSLLPLLLSYDNIIISNSKDYDNYSSQYDIIDGGVSTSVLGIDEMRKDAAVFAKGDVVEVGIGTGLQSKYYDWNAISSYTGIDNSNGMLNKAKGRLNKLLSDTNVRVELITSDATSIPLPSSKVIPVHPGYV